MLGETLSKPTESRWLIVSNLPETAIEETIKQCFERHGHVQSIQIDDQRMARIAFLDIRTASIAHHAENILDQQQLRTAFYDGSTAFLETSPVATSIIERSSSSPSSITTDILIDKTMTSIHDDREKRTPRSLCSPEENTRHQVVPMKDDSSNKRKTSSNINSKTTTKIKSTRRKHETSSSERSHSSSKHHRQYPSKKSKRRSPNSNHSRTKILKIHHLPSKMSTQLLRDTLRNIFIDFKKSSHLLNIKLIDDYALLTFRKCEDVDRALLFIMTKSINGIRLKAESYDGSILSENDEHDLIQRADLDADEYSAKATRTLYIGNLPTDISYQELREIYSVYGEIIEIEIKRQQPQHSQIFAFIQYTDIKSVVKALKSKMIHHHLIKLGFGKSQPTNVLWLDDLPLNITELVLRSFVIRLTNLLPDEILDIYIDNQNCQKIPTAQCLIYFTDTVAAQNAINSIRGKKFDSKRIQVDFASRVFLTRFSDIIQETNQKKNNDRWPNRRYSKVSDASSSIARDSTRHHSSSSSNHSSINHKKLIKSETDKHANTERIFDWLMQHPHPIINDNEEEKNSDESISIQTKKEIPGGSKKIFQTKIIPLESDSSLIQSDIRLKIYPTLNDQFIRSMSFSFPNFAKTLIKSSKHSMILNPKAYLKHSLKKDLANDKELDERIKLLDQQIQMSTSVLSSSTIRYDQLSTSAALCNEKFNVNLSTKPFDRLDLAIKFKRKSIPPPLSVITTFPISSSINDSPVFLTPKSMTPSSAVGSQHHSPGTTFSPISKQQPVINSPKPTILKSILKQPSHLSQPTTNEIRKAVHIISTKSSLESTIRETLLANERRKPVETTTKPKLIETIKQPMKIVKKTPVVTKPSNQLTKISKPLEMKKKLVPKPKQPSVSNKPTIVTMKKPEQKLPTNDNKVLKKSPNNFFKKTLKFTKTSCMYDRIKERSRTDQIRNSFLPIEENTIQPKTTQPSKGQNVSNDSCKSSDEKTTKIIFDSEIFDTEGNDAKKKVNQPPMIRSKFQRKDFVLKKRLKSKIRIKKRSLTDDAHRSSKKVKLQSEQTVKLEISPVKIEDQPFVSMNIKEEPMPEKQSEEMKSIPLVTQAENIELSSQNLTDKSPSQSSTDKLLVKTSITTDPSHTIDTKLLITASSSDFPSSDLIDSRPIPDQKHLPISLPLFTPPYQHFSYPLFAPSLPDSPPLSTRTRSTSSCSSIIGNSFYNTILSGQQHWYDKESRRESLSKYSTTSSSGIGSDSTPSLRNSFELPDYSSNSHQILNSFSPEFYRMNDIPSCDPFDIHWEGYIVLKTDQAYIKTQLIAGNSQIARISINYWNSDLNHHLRISQRMRLEEIQLDGVKKHMQMDNDYCLLIAEANGLTPDEIRSEQTHLKNGVIEYLNEKKAAGIINILLPGVLQPVYVVHIFPPCQFASEILQNRAPDAYRCVVQNKTEQIYLLFIITSTIQEI